MSLHEVLLAKAFGAGGSGGGSGVDVTAEVGQTIVVEEVDANGKPTKWKAAEYQKKICGSEVVEVLPKTTFDFTEESAPAFTPLAIPSVGFLCKVTYNGTEYECKAVDGSALFGMSCVVLGNIGFLTGTGDTGEPFGVALVAAVDGGGMLWAIDGSEICVLSIKGEIATKIPDKYLPEYMPYVFSMRTEGSEIYAFSAPEVLEPAVLSGRMVIANLFIGGVEGYCIKLYLQGFEETDNGKVMYFENNAYKFKLTPDEFGTYAVENLT